MGNYCVMCGKEIPEGRQVCPDCEYACEHMHKQEKTTIMKEIEDLFDDDEQKVS